MSNEIKSTTMLYKRLNFSVSKLKQLVKSLKHSLRIESKEEKKIQWDEDLAHKNIFLINGERVAMTQQSALAFLNSQIKPLQQVTRSKEQRHEDIESKGKYKYKIKKIIKDEAGNIVELRCSYDENTLGKNPEGRKVKGVIHWVPAEGSVECEVRLYDRLFRSPNPEKTEEGGSFLDNINPGSLQVLSGCRAEPSLAQAQPEDRFQFEREGYFCADLKDSQPGRPVFNRTVTLRDSWGS